jgi:hypothetical protein
MPIVLRIILDIFGVIALLFLAIFLWQYPRMRRLQKKAESFGTATCKRCGYVGALSLRSGSNGVLSSDCFRLVCAACGGHDWQINS